MTLQRLGKVLTSILLVFLMTEAVFAATATTTVLAVGTNPQWGNQRVTLTATVSGQSAPTGQVTFKEGSNVVGTAVVNASGIASTTVLFSKTGNLSLTGRYDGDANNLVSNSNSVSVRVSAVTTTTTVSATPSPGIRGQTVTLVANVVSPVPGAIPTGSVQFRKNNQGMGSAQLDASGTATLGEVFNEAGNYTILAEYNRSPLEDSSSATTPLIVNLPATSTALTISENPVVVGRSVSLTAVVSGNSPHGSVTFKDGAATLGTYNISPSGSVALTTVFTAAGSHSLTASYSGDSYNAASVSAVTSATVYPPGTVLEVAPNPAIAGQVVKLTASVWGVITPTGVVTFNVGSIVRAVPIVSGRAVFSGVLPAGQYSVTASYSGDGNNNPSSSGATPLTVNPAICP